MLPRPRASQRIAEAHSIHPICAILGPRQCGKTTLARSLLETEPYTWFDLANPVDVRRLSAPVNTLEGLRGRVVIDEVQRQPQLFEILRVLVDRPDNPARFLVLGSASPWLVRAASESLAGRISGFDLDEVGPDQRDRLWLRGGFPRSYLAPDDRLSHVWRDDFVRTFLERDLPQLGIGVPAETAPVLDDDRPLPRAGVERSRAGSLAGQLREHRAALPRHPRGSLHGARPPVLGRGTSARGRSRRPRSICAIRGSCTRCSA